MSNIVHVTLPGTFDSACREKTGWVIDWDKANDPENPTPFTCGACWKVLAGGVEPMGGSLHLSAAHGAGEND